MHLLLVTNNDFTTGANGLPKFFENYGVDNLPYNFKTRSADVGEEVFALGYPKALSVQNTKNTTEQDNGVFVWNQGGDIIIAETTHKKELSENSYRTH